MALKYLLSRAACDVVSVSPQLLSHNVFGYVIPITSFVVAWLETWFLDFKVLPQEADDERGEAAIPPHMRERVAPPKYRSPEIVLNLLPSDTSLPGGGERVLRAHPDDLPPGGFGRTVLLSPGVRRR